MRSRDLTRGSLLRGVRELSVLKRHVESNYRLKAEEDFYRRESDMKASGSGKPWRDGRYIPKLV